MRAFLELSQEGRAELKRLAALCGVGNVADFLKIIAEAGIGWQVVETKRIKCAPGELPAEKIRSIEQNNYYWGAVIPSVRDYMGEWNPNEIHEALKQEFLEKKSRLKWDARRVLKLVKSTTDCTTVEMAAYIARIRNKFAVTSDGQRYSVVPAPNQAATVLPNGKQAYMIDPHDLSKAYEKIPVGE